MFNETINIQNFRSYTVLLKKVVISSAENYLSGVATLKPYFSFKAMETACLLKVLR